MRKKKQDKYKIIYLDLDGPVLDVSKRYYAVHSLIVKKLKIKSYISKERFWRLKKAKHHPLKYNKSFSEKLIKKYNKLWLKFIEQRKYLKYDKTWSYAKNALSQLSKESMLNLVTVRQGKKNLLWELKRLGLFKYFDNIFVSNSIGAVNAKAKLIRKDKGFRRRDSIIIGDTEVDVQSGKECHIKTIAVHCGIRNQRLLRALKPDLLTKDITTIARLIRKGKV